MGRLSGKTCLVTAAGQGIGRATVEMMVREGASVVGADINQGLLDQLARDLPGVTILALDVRDGAAISAAAAAHQPDVLFNCAGFVATGTILECDEDQWNFSVSLNMTAMYRMARAFLPGMLARGSGVVINMASVASTVIAAPNRFVYGATKAGVIGMTKSIAADYVAQGIRAHAICPGTVESPSLDERLRATGDYAAAKAAFVARQPIGRLGKPAEIAALVVYLASDEATYSTGGVHVIDGGWSNT